MKPYFFTQPLTIIDVAADAKHKAPYGRVSIEMIILHSTEGIDSRAWLSTTSVPPVSVHRLISRDGTIYKIVPDYEVAWGAGNASLGGVGYAYSLNERSLQIELERKAPQAYTDAQLKSCAKQVVEWYGLYGSLPILYHLMIDRAKTDPEHFPRIQFDTYLFQELGNYL
jgi:N-acetyl-anhydromuramyl-L-alanine amidase AmpD